LRCEAEGDQIVTDGTRERTKHEAMAQLSAVGVPVGAVLEPMELTNEPSFRQRGILQTMTHGERTMMMPNWPVRFDGVPTAVKSAPLLGEHTAEVLADWLGLDAAASGESVSLPHPPSKVENPGFPRGCARLA
jgi:crotonobetainyl-CoA:carnitine CoA-transferase CaiB-like acyl-CoA transferase